MPDITYEGGSDSSITEVLMAYKSPGFCRGIEQDFFLTEGALFRFQQIREFFLVMRSRSIPINQLLKRGIFGAQNLFIMVLYSNQHAPGDCLCAFEQVEIDRLFDSEFIG